jgi:hypothetical protein
VPLLRLRVSWRWWWTSSVRVRRKALALHGLVDPVGERLDGRLQLGGAVGDHRVGHLREVDVLLAGHVGDRLAGLELGEQLRRGDPEGVGGRLELDAPARMRRAGPGGIGGGRRGGAGGAVLGPGNPGGAEHGTGHAATGEGHREGGGTDEVSLAHDVRPFEERRCFRATPCDVSL